MKTVILVHSQSGTTLQFAKHIATQLKEKKHDVELIHLQTDPVIKIGSVSKNAPFKFTNLPDIKGYELILLGGPVWAFSASPVAIAALEKLENLSKKKFLPFVTMGFPFPGMGGKKATAI
jgi:flavodoxin